MNESYSAKTKSFIFKAQSKKNISQRQFDKFFYVQLIYFQTLNSVLFQLLKHEISYHSTNNQKYMMRSMSNNDFKLQAEKYLIVKKQEILLIFTIKFT